MRPASKFSRYVLAAESLDGDYLLMSSYMGAIVRIPRDQVHDHEVIAKLKNKWREDDVFAATDWATPQIVDLLSANKLLQPVDSDERTIVDKVLKREASQVFHLIVLPHEDCNFRCVYCYETFERGLMPHPIAEGLMKYVDRLTASESIRALNVSWFGGEPCLAMNAVDQLSQSFIQSCNRAEVQYRSSMTTNGYFLDERNCARLSDDRVTHFQVTLDGPRETHDQTRHLRGGQGTFDRIYANLRRLHESEIEATFTIRVNVTPENRKCLRTLIDQFSEDFDSDKRFALDFHAVGHWGGPRDAEYAVFDGEKAFDVCLDLAGQAARAGFAPDPLKRVLCSHGGVCYAGKQNSMVVGSDGTVYKCTVALQDDRNKVGHLDRDGVLTIDPDRWGLWVNSGSVASKCTSCSFQPSCQGKSCPLETIAQNGVPPCPMTEDQLASLVRLTAASYAPVPHW